MNSMKRFFLRLFNVVTGRSLDERLNEEIQEHIALQVAENLRAGLSPVEARREAMVKFGSVETVKQDYRAELGLIYMENLLGDFRNAGRSISRMPGLAAVIILSHAIGIGVNTVRADTCCQGCSELSTGRASDGDEWVSRYLLAGIS